MIRKKDGGAKESHIFKLREAKKVTVKLKDSNVKYVKLSSKKTLWLQRLFMSTLQECHYFLTKFSFTVDPNPTSFVGFEMFFSPMYPL